MLTERPGAARLSLCRPRPNRVSLPGYDGRQANLRRVTLDLVSRLRSLVAVACLVTLAGCTATATPSATATLRALATPSATPAEAGTGTALLTLPENWTEVEMTEAGLRNLTAMLRDSNPEFASMVDQWLANGTFTRYEFFAFGYEDGVNIGNVNIIRTAAGGLSLDGAEPLLRGQVSQIPGVSDISSRRVSLPIGDALLITESLTMQVLDSDLVQTQHGYFVIEDDVLVAVTFTCQQGNETCMDDADAMINTFRP